MRPHALQIISDNSRHFRWVLLQPGGDGHGFGPHSHAEDDFDSYEAALSAGTRALAAADEQPGEDDAPGAVEDADYAAAIDPIG